MRSMIVRQNANAYIAKGTRKPWLVICVLVAAILPFILITKGTAQAEEDPHRPTCKDARCQKIKIFLKAHYCGESPYGNGPADGCAIYSPGPSKQGMEDVADFGCEWSESKRKTICEQNGKVPPEIRAIVLREMHRLGLPADKDKETYFNVMKSSSTGWVLAEGYHQSAVDKDINITLCKIIVLVDQNAQVIVLRNSPFEKTNADTPKGMTWSVLGLADVEGNGHQEVILEGDAYEDHWIEVDAVERGSARTIFSGLGYYL